MGQQTIDYNILVALCQHIDDVVIAIDRHQKIRLANPAAEKAFNLTANTVIGQSLDTLSGFTALGPLVQRAQDAKTAIRAEVTLPDGKTHWVQIVPLNTNGTSEVPRSDMMRELIHSLKGPLSSAKSYIDLVETAATLTTTQSNFARKARLRLNAMLNQIHQLEDVAWLNENGTLRLEEVDLTSVIRRALIHLEGFAQQQKVTLTVDLPLEGCPFQGDEHRLERVVANLVHNAIKYSPAGGPVLISTSYDDARVVMRVIDHGIGISRDDLPHVFEKSFRVHTAATETIEGSGLGLAIVKAVVQMHGGDVFANSEIGKGSTFGFWLPCSA